VIKSDPVKDLLCRLKFAIPEPQHLNQDGKNWVEQVKLNAKEKDRMRKMELSSVAYP